MNKTNNIFTQVLVRNEDSSLIMTSQSDRLLRILLVKMLRLVMVSEFYRIAILVWAKILHKFKIIHKYNLIKFKQLIRIEITHNLIRLLNSPKCLQFHPQ